MPTVTVGVEVLWRDYKARPTAALRNRIAEHYLPLVEAAARRRVQRMPGCVDLDDLIGAGSVGLLDAIEKFDPSLGYKFETYCARRILGAMIDAVRDFDPHPRTVLRRSALIDGARSAFFMENGRWPSEAELAKRLGIKGQEFRRVQRDAEGPQFTSLFKPRSGGGGGEVVHEEQREIDRLTSDREASPLSEAQRNDLREFIKQKFNRSEQLVLTLYYFESMTMKEIGLTLGLSESRVSQMHTAIIQRLKARLTLRTAEL